MPKLPNDFIKSLPLKFKHNRHTLWQEIALNVNLQKNRDEQIAFLQKRVCEVHENLKKEGGEYIHHMASQGIINPYSGIAFEDQFKQFVFNFDFAVKMYNEVEPFIEQVNKIRKRYLGRPGYIVDKKILSNCKDLYKLPMIKDYVNTLPYLQHLDDIFRIIERIRLKRPIPNYISKNSNIEKYIKNQITAIDTVGWKRTFKEEGDYNFFCDLLVRYFEIGECMLPDIRIELVPKSKTGLAHHLYPVLEKFTKEKNISDDRGFYDIMRLLDLFKSDDDKQINSLMRKGKEKVK